MNELIQSAKEISIRDYLEKRGFVTKKIGTRFLTKSPFNRDTNPSFVIYPSNTYFDWSSGKHGDIIDLVKELEHYTFKEALEHLQSNEYEKFVKFDTQETTKEPFDLRRYITYKHSEVKRIREYARERGITEGYENGIFFTREVGESGKETWKRHPSIGFVHRDKDLQTCGIKLREIDPKADPRFNARGKLGLYILTSLENLSGHQSPVLYVVEGEANANSLAMLLKISNRAGVVLSGGAVSCCLKNIPEAYQHYQRKLIIDYDGNEELYKERLKLYEDLNAEPIRLILPKGEDINSLYMAGKMYLIEHLL